MITATCPGCQATLRIPDEMAGRQVRCTRCQQVIQAPEPPLQAEPVSAVPLAAEVPAARPLPRWEGDDVPRPRGGIARPRPQRKGWSVLLIISVVLGSLLVGCCGLGIIGYFMFIREIEEPVTPADREVVITPQRLAQFVPDLHFDPARGKLRKVRHFDGSRELTYEYETDGQGELYINCTVGVEPSAQDAQFAYGGLKIGTNLGLRLGGEGKVHEVERNDLWRWGEDSKCVVVESGGRPVGNLFMGRKGRRYFSLMIVGVYFEERQAIQELLGPMLQRLETYEK